MVRQVRNDPSEVMVTVIIVIRQHLFIAIQQLWLISTLTLAVGESN